MENETHPNDQTSVIEKLLLGMERMEARMDNMDNKFSRMSATAYDSPGMFSFNAAPFSRSTLYENRSSLSPRRGSTIPFQEEPAEDMDSSKKSIIVVSQQPYMYKDDELLQKLTVRSHIFNKIRYDEVKSRHRHDKCFNLASTLSANVIRQLLNNERMLQTKISKMPNFNQNIFAQFSDETVIDMIANFLKPTSVKDFGEKLFAATSGNLKSDKDGWEFGVKNYHTYLYPNLNELLFVQEEIYKLLIKAKVPGSKDDDEAYPKVGWGKREVPGLFRYFTYALGKYEKSFIQSLPEKEESLKALTSVEDFFALMRAGNDNLAMTARTLDRQEKRLAVPISLEEAFPQYSMNSELQGPVLRNRSKDEKPSLKLMDDAEIVENDEVELFFGSGRGPNSNRSTKQNYFGKSNILPERIFHAKPAERQLPCFSWVNTSQCSVGNACIYSHDDEVCRVHVETQFKQLADSPFISFKVKEVIAASLPVATPIVNKQVSKPLVTTQSWSSNSQARALFMDSDQVRSSEETGLSESKYVPDV